MEYNFRKGAHNLLNELPNFANLTKYERDLKQVANHYLDLLDAIEAHHNKRSHDRCWQNDEDLYRVAGLPARGQDDLPPEEEFESKCKEYKEGQYLKRN